MAQAPELCDANGALLPDLRMPVKAKLKSAARKWDEFSVGSTLLLSPRIRDVIEEMAPGAHYLVPVDVADHAAAASASTPSISGLRHDERHWR